MLTIPPEKLGYIILKAREYDEKVAPTGLSAGSNPGDDQVLEILEDRRSDPTREELLTALRDLNTDEIDEVLAMLWVGRGDFSGEEWKAALKQAHDTHNARAVSYLAETPMLGDLLEEGYAALGYPAEDLEPGEF